MPPKLGPIPHIMLDTESKLMTIVLDGKARLYRIELSSMSGGIDPDEAMLVLHTKRMTDWTDVKK